MWILSAIHELSEEIKKSRFICRAGPVESVEAAMVFLRRVSNPRATHNCWAYRVGQQARSSDDGEPGGTAGRPMLGAVEKQEVDRVMVVVTRHFGGIKLGAGGLARAYGGVVARCLQQAPREELLPMVTRLARVPFTHVGAVRAAVDRLGGAVTSEQFDAQGALYIVQVEEALEEKLTRALADATAGEVKLEERSEE